MRVVSKIKKIVNVIIPKNRRFVYALPHNNGRKDCYDLMNANSDNLLVVLNAMYESNEFPVKVFIECYDKNRISIIKAKYESSCTRKMKFVFLQSDKCVDDERISRKRQLRNTIIRYRCKYWLSDAGHCGFWDKTKRQKFICLSYSTPYKSGTDISKYGDLSYINGFLETSLLTASVHASEYNIKLKHCIINGFPRNDTLFNNNNLLSVKKWISSKTDVEYHKIIVYAPTYRDYPNAFDTGSVFGLKDQNNKIDRFLEENKVIIVAKLHPLQDTSQIKYTNRILKYESSYEYSLYDFLACSDILISDYSSVIHDYIVTGKPIILNFFDKHRYDETRGFAFEPIEYICPSNAVENIDDLLFEINNCIQKWIQKEKYQRVAKMFHRYLDDGSTKRVLAYLKKEMRI